MFRYFWGGVPGQGREWRSQKIAMNKRGANKEAIDAINAGRDVSIVVRPVKYLNNIVEQDHRAINGDPSPCSASNRSAAPAACMPASNSCT
jgi:transposase-like protein